jgi:hypothetical protein
MEKNPEHKHPAQPDTPDSSFARGIEETPENSPEKNLESDFARGAREGPEAEVEHKGRFSEGAEQLPDTPEKVVERRFSEGIEESPTSE